MDIRKVPISKVVPWDKNPRTVSPEDLARLRAQIEELGIYKPLVAYEDGDLYIVIGGNQRLTVYRERGDKEVEVSVVDVKTEARKVALSISDNDRAGYYNEDELAELIHRHKASLDLGMFKIDMGIDEGLGRLVETQGRPVAQTDVYGSGPKEPAPVLCPNCGAVVEDPYGIG